MNFKGKQGFYSAFESRGVGLFVLQVHFRYKWCSYPKFEKVKYFLDGTPKMYTHQTQLPFFHM